MTDLGFVHRFISGNTRNAPALLLLHGTGGDENDLIPLGSELVPGAALISVRGKVLENGMPRFFRRLSEGVFDLDDLARRTEELARFIEEARDEYKLTDQLVAVGYSNGANIVASLILREPGHIAGAILFRPMVPFSPEALPDNGGIPILLSAGDRDPIVPAEDTRRLAALFESSGADVSFHWHRGGHELGRDDIDAAKSWTRRHNFASETGTARR
jgi:phospholipase/carboxylesterase/glyoxalase family protein